MYHANRHASCRKTVTSWLSTIYRVVELISDVPFYWSYVSSFSAWTVSGVQLFTKLFSMYGLCISKKSHRFC